MCSRTSSHLVGWVELSRAFYRNLRASSNLNAHVQACHLPPTCFEDRTRQTPLEHNLRKTPSHSPSPIRQTTPEQTQSHQQVGSDPLLEAFLTAAVIDVFKNSPMFGGVLVALTATLISDVANQDPSTTVPYLLR